MARAYTHIVQEASAARTADGTGTDFALPHGVAITLVLIDVTVVSGTSPTLTVYLQSKSIAGTYIDRANSASITAVGLYKFVLAELMTRTSRFRWVIGGTTPSFTFSVEQAHIGELPRL